jgi:SAM-dependent methyltransferase
MRIIFRQLKRIEVIGGKMTMRALTPAVVWRGIFGSNKENQLTVDAFGRQYRVDTCGNIALTHLSVSNPNWVYGLDYQPIEMFDLAALLTDLDIDPQPAVFVDLGAGKGRAVLLATCVPFNQVIGVEISPELAFIGNENLRVFTHPARCAGNAAIVCVDVTNFRFPRQPLVVYLYNPFTVPIMQRVIANLVTASVAHARYIVVIYFRPELAAMWVQAASFRFVTSTDRFHVYDNTPQREELGGIAA